MLGSQSLSGTAWFLPPPFTGSCFVWVRQIQTGWISLSDAGPRHPPERRAERRAGIVLFLLGSATFALAISYLLARIAGADLIAVLAAATR